MASKVDLIEFEKQKDTILNTLALIDANVLKVKQLLEKSDNAVCEPEKAAFEFYDTTIEKYKIMVLSMVDLCESLSVLYNKNKHTLDVEIQVKQGRISEN